MSQPVPPIDPATEAEARAESGSGPPVLQSSDLFAGTREVLIQHGEDTYRLKLTVTNKLILTK